LLSAQPAKEAYNICALLLWLPFSLRLHFRKGIKAERQSKVICYVAWPSHRQWHEKNI